MLENNAKGGLVFPAIRESRAKQIYNDKKNYSWKPGKIIRPGSMDFNTCIWGIYQDIENPDGKTIENEVNYYKGSNGKAKHREFQDELKALNVPWLKLFDTPDVSKIHPKAMEKLIKYKREYEGAIEFPLFIEKYELLGYIDAIIEELKNPGLPIPIDFKFKHYTPKIFKDMVKKGEFPLSKDFTQMCVYGWELNTNLILGARAEKLGVCYYNTTEVGALDAEQEYYIDFNQELYDLTEDLLDEHKKEAAKTTEKCEWRFCPDHGLDRMEHRRYLLTNKPT